MSKEHRFTRIYDLLELTDDEWERFLPDLLAWREFTLRFIAAGIPASEKGLVWIDDGLPGELHHVDMCDPTTGKVTRLSGPDFEVPK